MDVKLVKFWRNSFVSASVWWWNKNFRLVQSFLFTEFELSVSLCFWITSVYIWAFCVCVDKFLLFLIWDKSWLRNAPPLRETPAPGSNRNIHVEHKQVYLIFEAQTAAGWNTKLSPAPLLLLLLFFPGFLLKETVIKTPQSIVLTLKKSQNPHGPAQFIT